MGRWTALKRRRRQSKTAGGFQTEVGRSNTSTDLQKENKTNKQPTMEAHGKEWLFTSDKVTNIALRVPLPLSFYLQ